MRDIRKTFHFLHVAESTTISKDFMIETDLLKVMRTLKEPELKELVRTLKSDPHFSRILKKMKVA